MQVEHAGKNHILILCHLTMEDTFLKCVLTRTEIPTVHKQNPLHTLI